MDSSQLTNRGFIFSPVGNGDSTTIVVRENVIMQVDLHQMEKASDEDSPHTPVLEYLIEMLPKANGRPYLSVFALTHPDEDHCLGFSELMKQVTIGEMWLTPRIFREFQKDLCDDAVAFRKEAKRRVQKTIDNDGDVGAGDRVRIIGYDDLLAEDDYEGFPENRLTVPGNEITQLDGVDVRGEFRAFVHAPFKDDTSGDRNKTSLGLQVTLTSDGKTGKALLLGDLAYPTVNRIFDVSDADDLEWNVFLAPHHCSKSVMYWQEEGEDEATLKSEIMRAIADAAVEPGYIVASSDPVPATDEPGDNPPHARAKHQYEKIVSDEFLCTQEHPDKESPEPIVFQVGERGLEHVSSGDDKETKKGSLASGIAAARGSNDPPTERVGFGGSDD